MKHPGSLVLCLAIPPATAVGVALAKQHGVPALGDLAAARYTGYAALGSLLLSLSVRPIADLGLLNSATRIVIRRRFGILAAILALAHFSLVWARFYPGRLLEAVSDSRTLQSGGGALSLLLLLWLTSYPRLVRWARVRNWKALHSLSLVAGALAVLHFVLGPWTGARTGALVGAYYLLLVGWRLVYRGSAGSGEGIGQIESGAANT